jgi:hypothetical protein
LRSAPSGSVRGFRPDPEDDLLAAIGGKARDLGDRQMQRFGIRAHQRDAQIVAAAFDRGGQEVHRRRTHEVGDEQIGGIVVDFRRRADLLQDAILEDDDLGRQRHRLDLVMGDVDDGGTGVLVQRLDFGTHLDAQFGIEIGERLVEQEDARLAHQRPAHGDALALAAGQLARRRFSRCSICNMSWRPA